VGSLGRLIGVSFVVASSTQCRLLTDPVNEAPKVEMRLTSGTITRGKPAVFSASAQDPDEEAARLRLQWFQRDGGACPTTLAEARAATEQPAREGPTFEKKPVVLGPFCVWVMVTDSEGARAFAGGRFDVINGAPKAVVRMLSSTSMMMTTIASAEVPLFSEIQFSASGSEDPEGDPLRYQWDWRAPAGEPLPAACAAATTPPGDQIKCWRFDRAGAYELELRVGDMEAWSEPVMIGLTVAADRLPCIGRTEPPHSLERYVADPTQPLTFRLLDVDDDGDPFPTVSGGPPTGEVVWSYRVPGSPKDGEWRYFGSTTQTTFGFARDYFRYGDLVEVRVDYRDRVPAHAPATTCGDDAPTCPPRMESSEATCRQRVLWKVSLQ
jgi:hypothetical protein